MQKKKKSDLITTIFLLSPNITKHTEILDGAAALDNRPPLKWPIHFILGDAPTLNPKDTTKVQV